MLQGEVHHLVQTVSHRFFFMQTKRGLLLGQGFLIGVVLSGETEALPNILSSS